MACSRKLKLVLVDAQDLENATCQTAPVKFHKAWHDLYTADGILVPGGFGKRGSEGIIAAARSARENGTPFLGICLGMQLAVVEYARNVCGITTANSEEFKKEKGPKPLDSVIGEELETGSAGEDDLEADEKSWIIINMADLNQEMMGATMRLGLQETHFQPGSEWSKMRALYQNEGWVPLSSAPGVNGMASLTLSDGTFAPLSRPLSNGTTSQTPYPSNGVTTNGTSHPSDDTQTSTTHTSSPLIINERHRHRYEVNPAFIEKITSTGTNAPPPHPPPNAPSLSEIRPTSPLPNLLSPTQNLPDNTSALTTKSASTQQQPPPDLSLHFVGKDATGHRMEILELRNHPWFVGVQFHPEYLSRVLSPSKPYLGFVAAAAGVLGDVVGAASQ